MVNIQGINTAVMWVGRGTRDPKEWESATNGAALVGLAYVSTVTDGQPQTETTATADARMVGLVYNNISDVFGDPQQDAGTVSAFLVSVSYNLVVITGQPQAESAAAAATLAAVNYIERVQTGQPATEAGTSAATLIALTYA